MWLVVTGWMETPHHIDRLPCSQHAAKMTNCDLRKQHLLWQSSVDEQRDVKYVADQAGKLETTVPFIRESPV